MDKVSAITGGVTTPRGYTAGGVRAHIKNAKGTKPDVGMLVSECDAAVAATFTTNKVQGAHVTLCRQRLQGRKARAVVINSGNANACTGAAGSQNAERMAELTGQALGVAPATVWVCSTGTIGIPLPMDRIETGIQAAAKALSREGGETVARAIMTTDTVDKQVAFEFTIDGKTVRLGGMAKGAGMIEPNMATMLAFLTTDAAVEPGALQACLSDAVGQTFNAITIDGDESPNDTVILMANGLAGNEPLNARHPEWSVFEAAVDEACRALAMKIVADGEGATRFVTLHVQGAASAEDARRAAKTIANSLLVKTSWFGGDPNWGRVISAAGRSGVAMDPARVAIRYDGVTAVRDGQPVPGVLKDLEAVLKQKQFTLTVLLNLGQGASTVYTCDCSEEYVKINSEYMT